MDFQSLLNQPVALFIFLVTIVTSVAAFADKKIMKNFILRPYSILLDKEYYRILTSGLVHLNIFHLGMNMVVFFYFCFMLEKTMVYEQVVEIAAHNPHWPTWVAPFLGHAKFFILYTFTLLLADIPSMLRKKEDEGWESLGASGAISGVVISLILFKPNSFQIWFMDAWIFGVAYLVISLLLSRLPMPSIWKPRNMQAPVIVNHEAHFWGGLFGGVLTLAMFPHVSILLWQKIMAALSM